MVDSALVIPGSFGSPEPYAIRVFSTLNGPAAFGVVIGAALLLLVVRFRPAYLVAATAGGLAFLLSLCRTAWIAWIIALIVYAVSLGGRARLRILVIGVGLVLVVVGVIVAAPLAPTGRFTDIVTQRMETLANPTGDVSLDVRENSLKSYVDAILDHPEGYGLGSTGVGTGLSSGDQGGGVRDFDNGALEALYSFGIFGGICWLLGLGTLVLRYAVRPFPPDDRFANAARAVVLFCVVAYGATNTAAGVGGIFLWSGLGLCAAARDWAVHRGAGAAVSGPRGDDPLRLAEHRSPSVRTIASGGRHTSLE
jgi:O-antigen ligase